MQGSRQVAEGQLLRTGGPGEQGAGIPPGTVSRLCEQGRGPTRPPASRQWDLGPESRASGPDEPRESRASSLGAQTDQAQGAAGIGAEGDLGGAQPS